MARTYYSQLLAAYNWEGIVRAIQTAVDVARDTIEEFGLDNFPTDGVDGRYEGIYANCTLTDDADEFLASVYLGQTYRDSPSGSFYAPWSAVPDSVRDRDTRWYEAFERAANKYDLEPMAGEGDPTDTYVYTTAPIAK